jgi:hypothetical protein
MVCFVIIRHVDSVASNNLWIECYKCIRNFYKDEKILIIDSNSNYDYVTDIVYITNNKIINTEIIRSEFLARGEILGYYYFYKSNIRDYAVILQDGMFIQQYIDFKQENKMLWHFDADNDNREEIYRMLHMINYSKELITYYNNKHLWNGCFSSVMVINNELLEIFDKKYNLFNLLNIITTQFYARGFERIVGLLFLYETGISKANCSVFGNVFNYIQSSSNYHWSYSYNDYITTKTNCKIVKVWGGR